MSRRKHERTCYSMPEGTNRLSCPSMFLPFVTASHVPSATTKRIMLNAHVPALRAEIEILQADRQAWRSKNRRSYVLLACRVISTALSAERAGAKSAAGG